MTIWIIMVYWRKFSVIIVIAPPPYSSAYLSRSYHYPIIRLDSIISQILSEDSNTNRCIFHHQHRLCLSFGYLFAGRDRINSKSYYSDLTVFPYHYTTTYYYCVSTLRSTDAQVWRDKTKSKVHKTLATKLLKWMYTYYSAQQDDDWLC